MLSRTGYNNNYSIFNIPQDTLYAVNKNTAKAASQILYSNAYSNSFATAINSAMNNAVGNFSSSFGSSLKGLQQSAGALSNKNSSVYNTPKAVSTSSNFSVAVQGGAAFATHAVQISNLATAQKNISAGLASKSAVTLNPSDNKFSITKDGKSYNFEVDTTKSANNGEMLKSVAEAINKKGIGVSASVATDESGNAKITLKSNDTGTKNAFTVEGSLATNLGFNKVSEAAVNAKGTLDNKAFESASNTLNLDNGKTAITLKDTNTTAETFQVVKDEKGITAGVEAFVKSYNNFMDFADNNSSKGVDILKKQMSSAIKNDRFDLQDLGITSDENGRLKLNKDTLGKLVNSDSNQIKSKLSNIGSFAESINRRANSAMKSPLTNFLPDSTTTSGVGSSDMYNYLSTSQKVNLFNLQSKGSILDIAL